MNPWMTMVKQATEIAQDQTYPASVLYMVATPIGNLADLSLRAIYILSLCDTLACEDTRQTQRLLKVLGLQKPMVSLHQHNEHQASEHLLQRLASGERVAYVTDAGTPGISDPGARLCLEVRAAGYRIIPIPGASSLTALLSVSACLRQEQEATSPSFLFSGFLPTKAQQRQAVFQQWLTTSCAIVALEAPHRIATLAQELRMFDNRRLTVARELTKQFEHIQEMPASQWIDWVNQHPLEASKGEWIFVLHPLEITKENSSLGISLEAQNTLRILLKELPLKTAVKLASQLTSERRNDLYEWALLHQEKERQ